MGRVDFKALWLVMGLSSGCNLLVDTDPDQIGDGDTQALCKDTNCEPGTHCVLQQVQCIKAPCDPQPVCVADDVPPGELSPVDGGQAGQACGKVTCGAGTVCCNASCGICTPPDGACIQLACEETDPPVITCASTLCIEGTICVDGPNGPTCVPQMEENPCNLVDCFPEQTCKVIDGEAKCVPIEEPTPATCATILCAPDTYCDDISGEPKCLPLPSCDGHQCEAGTHCELEEVTCVRAPCPPQPTCVADADPCSLLDCAYCQVVEGKAVCLPAPDECTDPCLTAKCSAGTHCEAQEVQCVRAPCCPVASCVPNSHGGQPCGHNTCTGGTYCCNDSCGICAPKGGACTQQFCEAEL